MRIFSHDKVTDDELVEGIVYWEYLDLKTDYGEAINIAALLTILNKLQFDKNIQWRINGSSDNSKNKNTVELHRSY